MSYTRPSSLRYLDAARSALTQADLPSDDRITVARWWIDMAKERKEREVAACREWAEVRATCTGEGFRLHVLKHHGADPSELWKVAPETLEAAALKWLSDSYDVPF